MPVILILVFLAFWNKSEANTCTLEDVGKCSFYKKCVENQNECGIEGYAIGYGLKYCRLFGEQYFKRELSRVWRDETMKCLQRELFDYNLQSKTCNEIKQYAFDSHPDCYVRPVVTNHEISICHLNKWDVLKVYKIVDRRDAWSSEGRRQMHRVSELCFSMYLNIANKSPHVLEQTEFWWEQALK